MPVKWILLTLILSILLTTWVERTIFLESRGNVHAIGDNGMSRGPAQIQERIWNYYGGKKPWSKWAHDMQESKRVCRLIIKDCIKACQRHKRPVTFYNMRWYYRHGGF